MKIRSCLINVAVLSLLTLWSCNSPTASISAGEATPGSRAMDAVSTLYTSPAGTSVRYGSLYPHAIQLKYQTNSANNGKVYATFEKYTVAPFTFPVFESTDSAQTWTRLPDVTDQVNGWGLKQEPFLFEMPQTIGSLTQGTILMIGNSEPADDSQTKIDIYKSTDLCRTWTFVSSVASGGPATMGTATAIWEPYVIVANNKLICFYSDERGMTSGGQKIVLQTSTNGTTWNAPVDVVSLGATLRPGMPVVAKLANGNYALVYELIGWQNAPNMLKITSNPESWTPADTGTWFGSHGGDPYIAVMNDGKVVAGGYNTGNIYVNTNNASGTWYQQTTPVSNGYRRSLTPMSNGRLLVMSGGPLSEPALNSVTYADIAVTGSPSYYKVVNRATGKALDGMGSGLNGANACQYSVNATDNQLWQNLDMGNGYWTIINKATGLGLDNYGATADGATMKLHTSNPSPNQQWTISPTGSYWKVLSRASGKALDTGGQTADGTALQQWYSNTSFNQQWSFTAQ